MSRTRIVHGQSRMQDNEVERIIELLPDNGQYLEIGTLCGATVSKILDRRPDVKAVALDILSPGSGNPGYREEFKYSLLKNYIQRRDQFNIWLGDFSSWANRVTDFHKFNVVTIDGDHSYEGVLKDLSMVSSLVCTRHTKIVVHDHESQHSWLQCVKEATELFLKRNTLWTIQERIGLSAILGRTE